jgi:hypothetical protein
LDLVWVSAISAADPFGALQVSRNKVTLPFRVIGQVENTPEHVRYAKADALGIEPSETPSKAIPTVRE